jgi:chromosome segregation ATPase
MIYPNCILEEVDAMANQKVVNVEEPCEEICTSDYHTDNCDCFSKQEQKIKELQAELDRQRKIQEEKKRKISEEEKRKQQQEKIRQEQEKKLKQEEEKKKRIEAVRIKVNECVTQLNEQDKIVQQKYKDYNDAVHTQQKLVSEYYKLKYEYDELNGVCVNDLSKLFNIILNPSFNRF